MDSDGCEVICAVMMGHWASDGDIRFLWGEYPIRGFSGDLSYIPGKDGMLELPRGHALCT